MSLKDRFEKVGEDGIEYRGAPFWSWNDDLDPKELARQVREMARVGLGGHFMHARAGLITEYMGPKWMECIKATVRASKDAGIKAWLYDEDCWPSGTGGGAIPARNEDYVGRRLQWEVRTPEDFKPHDQTVATFLLQEPRRGAPEVRQVAPKQAARKAKEPEQVLHFFTEKLSFGHQSTYVDVMNGRAIREFIHHTYSAYRRALRRELGGTVPGMFTDEPQWGRPVPWSYQLPDFFKKRKGYDLLDALPMLVYPIEDYQAFRYDFWQAATELYVASFTEQIGEWCEGRKIALTGHLNAENSLGSQMSCIGDAMAHYPHMQIPGIDHLQRRITDPLLCKQVSSVAHQFGGRRVLSEMFGCSGWNVSFEELKWIAEWQFVLGVDLVCQHLALYSARGCRKRDYPPSLHYQQPWWDDYRLLNDYFARLTYMLTRGKHVADVLLLHSIESAWLGFHPDNPRAVKRLNKDLVNVSEALLGLHYDFDFGDEGILAEHGRVSKGALRVKSGEYKVVVVPPCLTLRSTTLSLLDRFMQHGGTVLLAGDPPERVDGRPSEQPAEVLAAATRVEPDPAALKAELAKVLPPRIEVLDEDRNDAAEIYVQQRDVKDQQIYFLANTSRDKAVTAKVRLPRSGRLERWDPATGDAEPLKTRKRGKTRETTLEFEPMGSHLLVLHRRRRPVQVRTRRRRTIEEIELSDAWTLERSDPNALTLDRCAYRIGEGEWSEPLYVLGVQDNLRHIPGAEVCEFKYTFTADFAAKLPEFVHLVVEEPQAYEISMNGLPVGGAEAEEQEDLGWWRDISFRRLDVSHFLKPQDRNEIVLRRVIEGEEERKRRMKLPETTPAEKNRLRYGPEIESVYVIGDFLVRSQSRFTPLARRALRTQGDFVLVDNWSQVHAGDLVAQGLPFYAGRVELTQTVLLSEDLLKAAKGATLAFGPPDATVTKVRVNGNDAGTRAWRPYKFEVDEWLTPGRNDITIELAGTCRNLLGPHHHTDGELYGVGPSSFRSVPGWIDSGRADSQWTDRYSFTRFGPDGPAILTLWK
jgi:hypothetical protein